MAILSCVSSCPPPIIFLLPEERASGFHLVQIIYNEFAHLYLSENSLFYLYPLKIFSLGIEFQFGSIFFQHLEGITQWSLGFHCYFIAAPLKVLFLFLITFNSFSSYLILNQFYYFVPGCETLIYPDWASQGFSNLCVSIFPQLWLNILILLHLISLLLWDF